MIKKQSYFHFSIKYVLVFNLFLALSALYAQQVTIPISSEAFTMVLQTDENKLLKTVYFGESLANESEYASVADMFHFKDNNIGIGNAAYTPAGTWNLSEPAIQVIHADGNTSLDLRYVSHSTKFLEDNIRLTSVLLKDPVYPFQVTLFYKVFIKENVIEQWTEIKHNEKKKVTLQIQFGQSLLYR